MTSDYSNNIMNYAEKNADMIFYAFEQWSSQVSDYRVNNGKVGNVPEYSQGLYLFYLQDRDEQKYPIYVGYTGRTFKKRFNEHAKSGVIKKCIENNIMTNSITLNVCTANFKPATAMVIEYVFLNTFNFPLNSSENEGTRQIDRTPPFIAKERIYEKFKETYEQILGEVTEIASYFPYFSLK